MSNRIEIYQGNTTTLACHVTGNVDLSRFTSYLTVKRKASDVEPVLSMVGFVPDPSGSTVQFPLSSVDTSFGPGSYVYDVVIDASTEVYTLVKDAFVILDGVR